MSSKKKDKKDLKIYRDLYSNNNVLLPFKGSDKIPEEMIEETISNEVPKWCEVTFEIKPIIKDNCISLDIKYEYDNIGDAGCDATPEEIKLVKNIIKQIKDNEKTKGFCWNYVR